MVSVFQYISECWYDKVVCIKVNIGDRSAVQVSISRFKTSVPVIWLIVKTYTCCTRGVMSYISFKILIILSTNIFIMLIPLSWIYWLPYLKCVSFSKMCSFNRLTYISFIFFLAIAIQKCQKIYFHELMRVLNGYKKRGTFFNTRLFNSQTGWLNITPFSLYFLKTFHSR